MKVYTSKKEITSKKVIVVDLDFHRPRTHRLLKVDKENGIAEYILGNSDKSVPQNYCICQSRL